MEPRTFLFCPGPVIPGGDCLLKSYRLTRLRRFRFWTPVARGNGSRLGAWLCATEWCDGQLNTSRARALRERVRGRLQIRGGNAAGRPGFGSGEKALVVSVLRDASSLRLSEVTRRSKELVEAARSGRISVSEMRDGCSTVTNLFPEAAILGVGATSREPVSLPDVALVSRGVFTLKPDL